jgi:hypothetical protein
MTLRQTMLTATLFAALSVPAAHAQVRTEPANSPFTYEALGATPGLQLNFRKRSDATGAAAAAASAHRAAPGAAAASQFTYDAVGATPQIKRSEPAGSTAATSRVPAAPKGAL